MDLLKSQVAGIGRLKIRSGDFSKDFIVIPTLHFIVFKSKDGYDAVCLELGLSSFGIGDKEAINNLSSLIESFINETIKLEKGKENIINLVSSNDMEEYWQKYRKVNFELGLKGISTEITDKLISEIEKLKEQLAFLELLKDKFMFGKEYKDIYYEVKTEEYKKLPA